MVFDKEKGTILAYNMKDYGKIPYENIEVKFTSPNNKYETALQLYDKWYKSKKPITFIEWCEKRLNQQG